MTTPPTTNSRDDTASQQTAMPLAEIRTIQADSGLSQERFAEAIGMNGRTMRRMLAGDAIVTRRTAEAIRRRFVINPGALEALGAMVEAFAPLYPHLGPERRAALALARAALDHAGGQVPPPDGGISEPPTAEY